jgi:putative ABC transport system permease protein
MRFWREIKVAFRSLQKTPWLTATAVLTLGLGLGAVGAMSSVVEGVILRPLPYPEPGRLVMIWNSWTDFPKTWVSLPELRLYQEQRETFADIGVFDLASVNLAGLAGTPGTKGGTGRAEPERVGAGKVSANLFAVLGVQPILGRSFRPEENQPGRDGVVLLSHDLWMRQYGGAPDLLGKTIEVDGAPRTVVGVMPEGFELPLDFSAAAPSRLWLPLAFDAEDTQAFPRQGGNHSYFAVGRLRRGVRPEAAGAVLRALGGRLTAAGMYPAAWRFTPRVFPLLDDVLGAARGALLVLLATVALVLLIACANVALLLFAWGQQRRRDLAIRAALGASRGRLVSQLLAESAVLAALGWAVGLGFAWLGLRGIVALVASSLPRVAEVALDFRVLGFLALTSLATALLTGLLPALHHSLVDPQPELQAGGRSGVGLRGHGFQGLLVATEMALAVVLVIGTGLLLRSFWKLRQVDVGFQTGNVLTLELNPSSLHRGDGPRVARYYEELLGRLRRLPGIRVAAAVRELPLASSIGDWGIDVEGYVPVSGERLKGDWQAVTPGYFEAMGIPLAAGRFFTAADRLDGQPVIVVNQAMAARFWPQENPLGKRVRVRRSGGGRSGASPASPVSPWASVVGVVGNVRHNGITADVKEQWYLPQAQFHLSTGFAVTAMSLVLKTSVPPAELVRPVREAIFAFDPELPAANLQTLDEVLARALAQPRITLLLMVICALLALTLAIVGTYGVIRYSVGQRSREMGLRLALGARPGGVVGLVVRQGMAVAAIGIAVGSLGALLASRSLAGLLYGVETHDPATFAAGIVILLLVALGASYLPARRVTKIDPMVVLREG